MTWAWWIWISAGVLLVTAEAFLGSFVILWFGFGAVLSGLLTLLVPGLHLGIQLLIAVLSGAVLMFLFRDRWVARGNAETDTLYTFSEGPGELKVSDSGDLRVSARGTYWMIANPEVLPEASRRDGLTVVIERFENNRAVLAPPDRQPDDGAAGAGRRDAV